MHQRLRGDPQAFVAARQPDAPIKQFFSAWGERERHNDASDPTVRAIAKSLDAYVPRGRADWERTSFSVRVAGARCEIDSPEDGNKPLPADRVLIPLVLAAREARAQGAHSVRGLWHSANILLMPDGRCRIAADWQRQPVFRDGQKPRAVEIAADLEPFPRSKRWFEPWMNGNG